MFSHDQWVTQELGVLVSSSEHAFCPLLKELLVYPLCRVLQRLTCRAKRRVFLCGEVKGYINQCQGCLQLNSHSKDIHAL